MIDEKLDNTYANEQLIYVITILIQCHTIENYTLRELSVNIFLICKHQNFFGITQPFSITGSNIPTGIPKCTWCILKII